MSGLRRLVPSNLGLKLVALGLALIVFNVVIYSLVLGRTRRNRLAG